MTKRKETRSNPSVIFGRQKRILAQIQVNGGEVYVTNCQPYDIPPNCQRFDCPMRFQSHDQLPVVAEAFHVECNPVGDLANVLIKLQLTNFEPS